MTKFLKALTILTRGTTHSEGDKEATTSTLSPNRKKDLEKLISEISRTIRSTNSLTRSGGLYVLREKHEELGRQLSELQRRMRMMDERNRLKFESRAEGLLADAAKLGITLPPP